MPSLQQITIKDCISSDMDRNLTGSDILHKHSINSLLEQNGEIINRGLASPNEGKSSISSFDLFSPNSGNPSSYHLTRQNNNSFSSSQSSGSSEFYSTRQSQHSNGSSNNSNNNHLLALGRGSVNSSNMNNLSKNQAVPYTSNNTSGGTVTSNGISCNGNQMQSTKAADFQFDNRNYSSNNTGHGTNSNNGQQQMKVMSRNHLTLDCTPASPRNFASSPLFGHNFNSSYDSNFSIPSSYNNQFHHRSSSPFPDYSNGNAIDNMNMFPNMDNHNLLDLMNCLNLNQSSGYQQQTPQPQTSTPFGSVGSGGSGCTSPMSPNEFDRMQNYQKLNTLRLLQHQQAQAQTQAQTRAQLSPLHGFNPLTLNHLMNGGLSQYKNWQIPSTPRTPTTPSEGGLDQYAKLNRNSAALHVPSCTWSGVLPIRSHRIMTYSPKVFLGGIPWDISEQSLVQIFKQFGPIRVEWPGKEQQASQPKGYVYIIFESEKQVKALLHACNQSDYNSSTGSINSDNSFSTSGKYYFKLSSKRIKAKDVEVIPWVIADSTYVKSPSQKLDPTKTVFVGALHGKLTAEGLAKVMNDLFDGVVYAGIDTDKHKYPIGSGRVTFNSTRSYMKAVSAAFIEIKTSKFTKKVQVDPYLEDSLCSACGVQQGPYYCRELICFRYFCRSCWAIQHNNDPAICNHKPLTRNSKSTQIIGVGPQQMATTPTSPSTPNSLSNPLSGSNNFFGTVWTIFILTCTKKTFTPQNR
uniref:CSON007073 protein n=1 Tax=Culicoides sonorensis TaxID=179676 RepID=A0A336M2K5_CULSO